MACQLKGQRLSVDLSIMLTMISLAICCYGLFMDGWWHEVGSKKAHDLFTIVNCPESTCVLATSSTEGWITAAQVFGILQLSMLIASLLTELFTLVFGEMLAARVAQATLIIAGVAAILQLFIVGNEYYDISKAFSRATASDQPLPKGMLLYNTLPVGICATSGMIALPACIALAIWRIAERGGVVRTVETSSGKKQVLVKKTDAGVV